ncbi:pyroglutamyl-peptidase 1 isoform X1 [Caretta caretta]|uniref:pyroglutamyl-peptidase 1 isoform X1 n=1 Tax=Caretta caretta TaxID=8467 RepID=UPI003F4B4F33
MLKWAHPAHRVANQLKLLFSLSALGAGNRKKLRKKQKWVNSVRISNLASGHPDHHSTPFHVSVWWFGPFGEHAVNASWIAVQELEKLGLGDGVDLYVYEIPVEYQTVQRLIPALWKKHSPQLVVHVGVSGMATTVTLEKCGHNVGYKGLDNCRFCPGSQCCVEGGPECIDSIIDMDAVCKRVSTLGLDVTVTISKDAGRYLCDFTYYTSLYQSHGRSAFVHVPPLGKPYTAAQLGRALQAIIEEMLDVLEHSEGKINCRHEH